MNWLIKIVEWYLDRQEIQQAEREEEARWRRHRQMRIAQNAIAPIPRQMPVLRKKATEPDVKTIQSEGLDRLLGSLSNGSEKAAQQNRQNTVPLESGFVQVHYKVYQGENKWRDESAWLTETGEVVPGVSAPAFLISNPAAESSALEKKNINTAMSIPSRTVRRKWARQWQIRRRRH